MMSEFRDVLSRIPASLPYEEWIRAAAALKNEGEEFESFDQWSRTCPEKYNADAARKTWDSVGGHEHPEITGKTLHYLRNYYNKIPPPPKNMLPPPESDVELYAQSEMLLSMLFPKDKVLEVIVTKPGTPKDPRRPGFVAPWPDALNQLQMQTVDNGAWFVINDLNFPLKGKAASDRDIKNYRYALVEADEGTREEQWQAMVSLPLIPPVQAAIWSGGKSIHYIVRIDASDWEQYKKRITRLYDYLQHQGVKIDSSNKNPSRLARLPGIKRGEDKQYLLAKSFGTEDWAAFEERLEASKEPDRRAVTSPINGQKGGCPPFDTSAYADLYVSELEKQDKKLLFWQGNFYLHERNHWMQLSAHELEARLSAFLQERCPGRSRIGKSMVTDLQVCLKKNYISTLDCPEPPFLIQEKKSIPDCMVFANAAVRLKDMKSTPLTECPVIKKDSNLFGEDDVEYCFAPEAQCPRWERAVALWFPEEAERRMFQQIFGYIISRSTALNVCFFWYGEAGTGKSTALKVLRALMGERRCSAVLM